MAANSLASTIGYRSGRKAPTCGPISTTSTNPSISRTPRLSDRATTGSLSVAPTLKKTTEAVMRAIPRRIESSTQSKLLKSTLRMATNKPLPKIPCLPEDTRLNPLGSISEDNAHGRPIVSNDNSNTNTVYGPVQKVINNNPITNLFIQGVILDNPNALQIKISADLKPCYVPQALYDAQLATGCMNGTRVNLLCEIMDWIKDPEAQSIFWLTGWAGTGKSAIAWTICSRARDDPEVVLGGSFFFSRSSSSAAQRDVRYVIATLAQVLARQSDVYGQALADELSHDPDILHKHISVQIETLLSKPLVALASSPVPIVFVIDALDECGGQSTSDSALNNSKVHHIISEMLQALIALSRGDVKFPVKFLITSRPETHIRDTSVSDDEFSKVLRLHTVDMEQVAADIRFFIAARLLKTPKLRACFTSRHVDMLTQQCGGLFIVATTALTYTFESGNDAAPMRFKNVLNASQNGLSTEAAAPLDRMYTLILEDAARVDKLGSEGLSTMLQLLAVLLSTRIMLSVAAVADLLGLPTEDVRATLSRLHAVVHVPDDDDEPGLRTLHASFGDYISRRAPSHIQISSSASHEVPARASVRVMAERLHFNISQSRSSYEPNPPKTPSDITLSLQYACTQWVYHIASLPDPSALDDLLSNIFCPRFLFWLEVMSVLGQVQRAAAMLHFISVTVENPDLSQFFRDANSFVASSSEAIERSASHIYVSALSFANKGAAIYKTFAPKCTGLACVDVTGIDTHGGRLVMTLNGYEGCGTALVYSTDGLLIALGSDYGTVHVWDTRSGEETVSPLRCGSEPVTAVVFVPNGTSVVAGTKTGNVCVWSLPAGQSTMQQLVGHSAAVVALALSSDSLFLASASRDRTVRVWILATGKLHAVFNGHDDPTKGIAVSPEGEVTTSGQYYFKTNEPPERYPRGKHHFRVSKTGRSMALVDGENILLWTQQNQDEPSLIRLEGHTATVRSAAISPNRSYVASASNNGNIRIWDVGNGSSQSESVVPPLDLAPLWRVLSFEGVNMVSALADGSLSAWRANIGETEFPPLAMYGLDTATLAISSDGHLLVTGSENGTVQLWNALTGEKIGEPLPGNKATVAGLMLSSNARWLSWITEPTDPNRLAGTRYEIHIWDVSLCQKTHHFHLPEAFIDYCFQWRRDRNGCWKHAPSDIVDISADGRLIAAGDTQGAITLWHIKSNMEAYEQFGISELTYSVRFSPDSTHIASGRNIWNISTGQLVFRLAEHTGPVTNVIYSPDGQIIATASEDETLHLWDAKTGVSVAVLNGHRASVKLLRFANDGSLVSGSDDGTICVWDVNAARLLYQHSEDVEDDVTALSAATLKDGWLTGPLGELLLWVPTEYRPYLQRLPCIHRVDSQRVVVKVGSDAWHRGQNWTVCWRGGELNVSDTV